MFCYGRSVSSAAIRANDRPQRGYRVTGDGTRNPANVGTVEARMEYASASFELKNLDDAGLIEGLAAGTGDVDRGGDLLLAGAFTKTLSARQGRPLPMLLHHDQRRPIGAWTDWRETATGLHLKGRMTMTTRDAQEAHALVRDGALTGLSIGWQGKGYRDTRGVRHLDNVELYEASLVAIPMHPRTTVTSVKAIGSARDIADFLREGGISGRQAKAAAGAAWKAINDHQDEPDAEAIRAVLRASVARIGTNEQGY